MSTTELQPAVAAPRLTRPVWRKLRSYGRTHTALISLPLVLLALEIIVWFFQVPDYVFPAPHEIGKALVAGFSTAVSSRSGFYVHIGTTLTEALTAFIVGSGLGIAMGAAVVQFPFARRLILPYVIGLQSVPKVAL